MAMVPELPRESGGADTLDVLLNIRTELSSLQSLVVEQHRQVTAQLKLLCAGAGNDQMNTVQARHTSASERCVTVVASDASTHHATSFRQSQTAPEPRPARRDLASLADSMATHALARGITFSAAMTSNESGDSGSRQSFSICWREVIYKFSHGLFQQGSRGIINWHGFDRTIGCIIFLNAVCIGLEIDMNVRKVEQNFVMTLLQVAEPCFLAVYSLELVMRFLADRHGAVRSGWVLFDLVLVVVGLTSQILVPLASVTSTPGLLQQLTLLRVVRLLRLVRALRLIKQFKGLWRLVNALLNSFDAILSTLALIILVVYVAGCIGVELILTNTTLQQSDNPRVRTLLMNHFNSVQTSMLTLLRFVTVDSLGTIYEPIIQEQPLFSIYFMILLMVISISLLNLVTATLVEGALESAKQDRETISMNMRLKVRQYIPLVRELFRNMDASGDGILTFSEIRNCLAVGRPHSKALYQKLQKVVPFDSVIELFESLDVNGDGEISEEEFIQGMLQAALGDRDNIEVTQVLRLVRVIARKLQLLEAPINSTLLNDASRVLPQHSWNGSSDRQTMCSHARLSPVDEFVSLDREESLLQSQRELSETADSI